MTEEKNPPVEVSVELVEPQRIYKVSFRTPGAEAVIREIRLGQQSRRHFEQQLIFDPLELGLERTDIEEQIGNSPRIDLLLPKDPIACLDWESLARGRVFRRTPRDYNFRRSPFAGPLRFGFVSTIQTMDASAGFADAIISTAEREKLDVKLINLREWEDFDKKIPLERFHIMHVLVRTELTARGPQVLIGGRHIPLEHVVRKVAQPGTRFVVLQDVTEDRRAVAALRWGAQSLPSRSESSILLCSAHPLSKRLINEMKDCYSSLLRDEPLDRCMAHLEVEHEYSGVSVVTHIGNERGLGLTEELGLRKQHQMQIQADLSRLGEPIEITPSPYLHRLYPTTFEITEGEGPLTELNETEARVLEGEVELKQRVKDKLATAEEDEPRYPAAWFYLVDAGSETAIPDTQTLTWPPPVGIALEFHFWLDIVKTGITSLTEIASIKKQNVPYPLILQITVWSEDFKLVTNEQQIELQAVGPTKHAKFPIKELPAAPRQAELFVFVRHEGTLIAVFRVEAAVTEQPEAREGAQIIEHAYLASDWFRFEETPAASALTIFITKKKGALQIFTLKPSGNPWAMLGPTESGLYEKNKEIYQEVQTLAHRAEEAIKNEESFRFATEGKRLAKLGYPLFGDIFFQGEEDAGVLASDYIRKLPEGSTLTIAIGREAQNLYIPWGLLYDRQPPFDYFDIPQLQGFLGYRYNLVVRPSTPHEGLTPKRQFPIRIGAAWLERHEETAALRAFYKPYEEANKLVIEPIQAEEHLLPALSEKEFDIVEFFCHGHTKLSGVFSVTEAQELIASYAASAPDADKSSLLMAIDTAGDSLLDLSGGFVTLTSLADSLTKRRMPGRPLILLSMCESAQVSASGTGFVPLFLRRGARAVIGTEGPTLWSLSREMDTKIIARLLDGQTISQAFYETRKELVKTNMLALIYTLYGDAGARLV